SREKPSPLGPRKGIRAGVTGFILSGLRGYDSGVATIPESLSTVVALLQAGRFDEARRICEQFISVEAGNAGAWYLLALIAWNSGDEQQAVACSERALELAPAFPVEHCNLGYMLVRRGRIDLAAAVFRRIIELTPGHAPAYDGLASVLKRQGNQAEAVA